VQLAKRSIRSTRLPGLFCHPPPRRQQLSSRRRAAGNRIWGRDGHIYYLRPVLERV